MKTIKLVIITGLSGAGKSQAIRIFEDLGYFCIDNLPIMLLEKFIEICSKTEKSVENVALGIDIRAGEFLGGFSQVMENLEHVGFDYDILFLEAQDEVIMRRYSTSRRRHPLCTDGGTIWDSIDKERKTLALIKEKATLVINTSNFTVNELRDLIINKFIEKENTGKILIRLYAFGYKFGIPLDSDLIFDVRFLPNPYYIEELKKLTGLDEKVKGFIQKNNVTHEFFKNLYSMLDFLLPNYLAENKAYLTIAIGCTGGKHRSVAIVDELQEYLQKQNYMVKTIYRDINKE